MLGEFERFILRGEFTLEAELRFYGIHKHEWLRSHTGEFAVIGGTTIGGFYPDYESAFRAGLQKFGRRSFLIKQVFAEEPVHFIY
ncbi:MAG: hypothetical protein DMG72_04585 [Acidobacteria bacterium]|nr:MAG: hypothetical protein DMG72_04585 [Acidobacteriota bacterium]